MHASAFGLEAGAKIEVGALRTAMNTGVIRKEPLRRVHECVFGVLALEDLRQIGGQTGDVLGGAEQVAETAILVMLAARLALS